MRTHLIDFLVWMALWVGSAWLLGLTPLSDWIQGAFTAGVTLIIHRQLFHDHQ